MKQLFSMLLVVLVALSLTACAGMGKKESAPVKCPACGYEFDAPTKR